MSKFILTTALVLSIGIVSVIKSNDTKEKNAPVQIEKTLNNSRVAVLATAD